MTGQRYRLNTPTLAILSTDGQKLPVTVPMGAVVQVKNRSLDGDRLTEVDWDGHTVAMFTIDLRDRGEQVDSDN